MIAPPTLFLVDDDPAILAVLDRYFRRAGYRVLVAPSADSAIDIIERSRSRLDLAILDVVLPAPGSPAVLEALRATMRPLRVLLISAYDEASIRRSSLVTSLEKEPRFRIVEKPFPLADLLDCVEELLASDDEVIEVATGEWRVPG